MDDDDDVYVYNKVIPQRSSLSCTGYQDEARDHHQELQSLGGASTNSSNNSNSSTNFWRWPLGPKVAQVSDVSRIIDLTLPASARMAFVGSLLQLDVGKTTIESAAFWSDIANTWTFISILKIAHIASTHALSQIGVGHFELQPRWSSAVWEPRWPGFL